MNLNLDLMFKTKDRNAEIKIRLRVAKVYFCKVVDLNIVVYFVNIYKYSYQYEIYCKSNFIPRVCIATRFVIVLQHYILKSF